MKLALGPILYFWSREAVYDFYKEVADLPVDTVYLGETVCSKRRALRTEEWIELADELAAAGKQPVLSTLALVEAESELKAMRRLVENGRHPVEANDMAAVRMAQQAGAPFVAGPHLNTYNPGTLGFLRGMGAIRWVMPVELSRETLAGMQADRPEGMETEVFGFGRLPLAFSARCFTARTHGLPKDDCQLRCGDYEQGTMMRTQEGAPFLTINGIQTQSGSVANLVTAVPEMREAGVDVVRVSPQGRDAVATVVRAFRDAIDGTASTDEALGRIAEVVPDDYCNGYWYGEPGMEWTEAQRLAEAENA